MLWRNLISEKNGVASQLWAQPEPVLSQPCHFTGPKSQVRLQRAAPKDAGGHQAECNWKMGLLFSSSFLISSVSRDAAPLPSWSHPAAVRLGPVRGLQWAGPARKAAGAAGLQPGVPSRGRAVREPQGHSLSPAERRVLHGLWRSLFCMVSAPWRSAACGQGLINPDLRPEGSILNATYLYLISLAINLCYTSWSLCILQCVRCATNAEAQRWQRWQLFLFAHWVLNFIYGQKKIKCFIIECYVKIKMVFSLTLV